MVLIEQYRHGADEVQLEIPGGVVYPNESHEQAASRELAEETGYIGKQAIEIGHINPNPALFHNKCYTFLVLDAVEGLQKLEETEDIAVQLVPLSAISELIFSGNIQHGLVVAAFYLYEHYKKVNLRQDKSPAL
ncbi:MAG TPA: NUDIX hydrolase [Patescibacteria group bacterium]|nr:NUDIX hydrolase [Patescibacteria group bacterium]